MSETPLNYNPEFDKEGWEVLRENVTQTMLYESGFGKSLSEVYDETYGPRDEGWKWEEHHLSDAENASREMRRAEYDLAHEALMNSLSAGKHETRDGISGSHLDNRPRRGDIDPFGRVLIRRNTNGAESDNGRRDQD